MITVSYHPGADAVFIHLSDRPSVATREVAPNIFADEGEDGALVAYDIQDARRNAEFVRNVIADHGPALLLEDGRPVEGIRLFSGPSPAIRAGD